VSQGYIWAAYLATYGLIVGYAVTLWHRLRQRDRSTDRQP
jgi:hypothetical protein